MNTSKKTAQITDAEYERLLKNVEEIEKLIAAAQKSCEEIERLRCHTIHFPCKSYRIKMHIVKKNRKSALG